MEPFYTHEVFPCFNEPQFTATFDIRVAARPEQKALSLTLGTTDPTPE